MGDSDELTSKETEQTLYFVAFISRKSKLKRVLVSTQSYEHAKPKQIMQRENS